MTTEMIYRPGLEGVVAGETAISTISDGLRYRGYRVEELADQATFEEAAYLVLHGELPTAEELGQMRARLAESRDLPDPIIHALKAIPFEAPMMDVVRTGASLLSHWDPEASDNSRPALLRKAERLLIQLPMVMAARHRLRQSLSPVWPRPSLSLAANVLWMLLGEEPSERAVRAMDVSLILYAEHEFNASTFASRVVASTLSDLHSSIIAAIGALKGPLHGGANEQVMDVLADVGAPERAEEWVRRALAEKRRIMGFGHRVYKTGDPRARYLKPLCQELAAHAGREDLERMAEVIEQIVTQEKGLPPNLDWPSARLYHYLGLPVDLYTPLFVASRVAGWSAHVIEQLGNNRLIRPRSHYAGPEARAFRPIAER